MFSDNVKNLLFLADYYYDDIDHPLSVAYSFPEFSDEWVVGLFHDILEDTDIDPALLMMQLAINSKAMMYEEIVSITRKKGETYFEYIRRLEGIAKKVKIVDLTKNLSRVDTLTESLKSRYEKALKLLTN
jgi:hypothetical protein